MVANIALLTDSQWNAYRVATTLFGAIALYLIGAILVYQFRHGHYEKAPTLGAGALLVPVLARTLAAYTVGPTSPTDNLYFRWLMAMSNTAFVIYLLSCLPEVVSVLLGTQLANGARLPAGELRRDKKFVWRIVTYSSLLVAVLFLVPTCYGFFASPINFDVGELVMNVGGLIIAGALLGLATFGAAVRGQKRRAAALRVGLINEKKGPSCRLEQLIVARTLALVGAAGLIAIYFTNSKAPVPISWFLPSLNLANVCHGLAVVSCCIVNGHWFRRWMACRGPVASFHRQRGRSLIKSADKSEAEERLSV
jgi:predicted small integral membrane protein